MVMVTSQADGGLGSPPLEDRPPVEGVSAGHRVHVVRGGVEPPTFRFSGLRVTVQDRPRRSIWLLSSL
jgi:hypothetical protein